jgi:hypothetical protein
MSKELELECTCGAVHGRARDVSAATVNRVVCNCVDCPTFAHHLGRPELLDALGGSDNIQVAPEAVSFDRGTEKIAAVRLGPKGLYRWYATCCKTPLGNTVKPSLPFVGIVYEAFRDARDPKRRDEVFGPPRARIYGRHAVGGAPAGATNLHVGLLLRTVAMILGWKLRGRAYPHPFFDRGATEPKYPVRVLTREEREAARPKAAKK